jgi:hypothetical protein
MKPIWKGVVRNSHGEGEFDQSALNEYMEILQWNPFVQLIYTNKKQFIN